MFKMMNEGSCGLLSDKLSCYRKSWSEVLLVLITMIALGTS
jgi:hypothetical protein